MIPGSQGQKFDASLLAGEFLRIAGARSAEQFGIRGVKSF